VKERGNEKETGKEIEIGTVTETGTAWTEAGLTRVDSISVGGAEVEVWTDIEKERGRGVEESLFQDLRGQGTRGLRERGIEPG